MEDSNLRNIRLEKLEKLKTLGIDPYPAATKRTHTIAQTLTLEGKTVAVTGRLFSFREHGNIAFADLKDESGKIQIFFQKKLLGDSFKLLKLLDIGDFLQVEGEIVRTTAGEISIAPTSFQLLTKSLRPLPSNWYGLKDMETRYRQRYLDLLLNSEVKERFNLRTKLISGIREYFDDLGFWEVETPALQPMYGGTNAKPFRTYMNALDQDIYLRIAVELYIKKLLVGGYEKVYEIAKDFRNEGIDHTHFPEFTMIEWYEAYGDYHTMMDNAEGLIKFLAKRLFGKLSIQVHEEEIDISKQWPRISMDEIMKKELGLDVEKETVETLLTYLKKNCPDVKLAGGETKGQLIFTIFDHIIPKTLTGPTWIIDYPQDVSPLSKPHRNKKGWVERFEGYMGGKEIFDGWTEITDASIQRSSWEKDTKAARRDKEEAQHVDEDFLTAMEYGLPPYGGIGVGIDRLVMLFTNTWAIKEVILFPTLRSGKNNEKEDISKQTTVTKAANTPTLKTNQDFSRKIVVVINKDTESWQAINAIAHVSAYLGNKMQEQFDTGGNFITKDSVGIPKNSQYGIIALSAKSGQMHNLIEKVRKSGLLYHAFIRDMFENDDQEVQKTLSKKDEKEIDYLAIGIFGENDEVDKLTKNYSLWK